jgi:competence protein ComEC
MPLPDRPTRLKLHTRPALVVAAAVAAGIALETRLGLGLAVWAWLLAGAACTPVAIGWGARGRLVTPVPFVRAVIGLTAAVAMGGARVAAWESAPPDDISRLAVMAGRVDTVSQTIEVAVVGRVVAPPTAIASGARLRVAVDSASARDGAAPVRGMIEVTLASSRYRDDPPPAYPTLELGDRVRMRGLLRSPPTLRNPADFDYRAYLARQGVGATMRVTEVVDVRRLGSAEDGLTRMVSGVQSHVRRAVRRYVRGEDIQGVMVALLIADRGGIDPDTRQAFADTGLMHLLAVSGLHILLVGLVLYNLLRPTLVRCRLGWRAVEVLRASITLVILSVYALVTGGSPSVVRAVVMAGAMVAARTLQRPADALNGLGLSALGLLLWRPTTLTDIGFQLSYSAVGALVLLSPTILWFTPHWMVARGWSRAVTGMLVASAAATLGTAPVLLAHFGRVPLGGLVLNVPAIPAANAALGAGLGLCLTAGPLPWAADAFAAVAEIATRAMLDINGAGASWLGWTAVSGFVHSPGVLVAMLLALLSMASWRAPSARWRLVVGAVAAAAFGTWTDVATGAARPRLDAVFLDVGQGDAIVLSFPGSRHVLVDAGPRDPFWDAGERTMVPHLRRAGIRRLEAVVITHPHADHFGGLEAVLLEVEVERVLVNGQQVDHPLLRRALEVADSLAVPVQAVHAGDTLDVGLGARFRLLGPATTPPRSDAGSAINDGSLVARAQYGRTSILLMGDAELAGEGSVVQRYGSALRSDVVKVGHHGSRTSSTSELVAAAATPAGWAVVQVARRNRYGLPDEEPLARWTQAGMRVATTSSSGAVWLSSDGRRFRRMAWRSE